MSDSLDRLRAAVMHARKLGIENEVPDIEKTLQLLTLLNLIEQAIKDEALDKLRLSILEARKMDNFNLH